MRLQPYREKDAENIVKWIEDEKAMQSGKTM